jgi:hypothetical protein
MKLGPNNERYAFGGPDARYVYVDLKFHVTNSNDLSSLEPIAHQQLPDFCRSIVNYDDKNVCAQSLLRGPPRL